MRETIMGVVVLSTGLALGGCALRLSLSSQGTGDAQQSSGTGDGARATGDGARASGDDGPGGDAAGGDAQVLASCQAREPSVDACCSGYAVLTTTGECGCVCSDPGEPQFDTREACEAQCGPLLCPPCVPPPDPSCVGTGPCGCGPYECACEDIATAIADFRAGNTACTTSADCTVVPTTYQPGSYECCSAYLSSDADLNTWEHLNNTWFNACEAQPCCDGGPLAPPACINGVCGPAGEPHFLCEATGGSWDPWACGHAWCGTPLPCLAVLTGCDCGPGRNFVDGEGCVADSACGDCRFTSLEEWAAYCQANWCDDNFCMIACGGGGAGGGCAPDCVPRPCQSLSAANCPAPCVCQTMIDCAGNERCYFEFNGETPACGAEGYYGQDVECCDGLVKRCGQKIIPGGACDPTGGGYLGFSVCLPCGNGVCTANENACSCPQDCDG